MKCIGIAFPKRFVFEKNVSECGLGGELGDKNNPK